MPWFGKKIKELDSLFRLTKSHCINLASTIAKDAQSIRELERNLKALQEKVSRMSERQINHSYDFHDGHGILFSTRKDRADAVDWIEHELPKYRKKRKRKEWWRKVLRLD